MNVIRQTTSFKTNCFANEENPKIEKNFKAKPSKIPMIVRT